MTLIIILLALIIMCPILPAIIFSPLLYISEYKQRKKAKELRKGAEELKRYLAEGK